MKLTDEQIDKMADASFGSFVEDFTDDYDRHFARAIESTVRQQDAELVRELVEMSSALLKKIHRDAPDLSGKLMGELEAALTRAQQGLNGVEPATCKWTSDADMDAWESACGEAWQFMNDGPTENNVRFCQGCGKPVEITPPAPTGGENGS